MVLRVWKTQRNLDLISELSVARFFWEKKKNRTFFFFLLFGLTYICSNPRLFNTRFRFIYFDTCAHYLIQWKRRQKNTCLIHVA